MEIQTLCERIPPSASRWLAKTEKDVQSCDADICCWKTEKEDKERARAAERQEYRMDYWNTIVAGLERAITTQGPAELARRKRVYQKADGVVVGSTKLHDLLKALGVFLLEHFRRIEISVKERLADALERVENQKNEIKRIQEELYECF